MQQHIEKTEQLIKKIDSATSNTDYNDDYLSKISKLKLEISSLKEKSEIGKNFYSELSPSKSEVFRKFIRVCEIIETNIIDVCNNELLLNDLKENLVILNTTENIYQEKLSYTDITNKILLLEEKYQNNEISQESFAKHIAKLEQLDILKNDSIESQNIKNIINSYKKELKISSISDSKYEQNITINDNLSSSLSNTENQLEVLLNMILENTNSTTYRPELDNLCELVTYIYTQLEDFDINIKGNEEILNSIITTLQNQAETTYSEQSVLYANANQIEEINSHIKTQTKICTELNNITNLSLFDQQFETLFAQYEKLEELKENMPSSIYENMFKQIMNSLYDNILQTINFMKNTNLTPSSLSNKGEKAVQLVKKMQLQAQELGFSI